MPNTVVKMPQLGESVVEGTIGRWLKNPGDRVERDEPLVEIQTDKVNAEVASPVAGILQQILLPEGTTAAVTTDMAIIGDEAPTVGDAGGPAVSVPGAAAQGPVASAASAPATPETSAAASPEASPAAATREALAADARETSGTADPAPGPAARPGEAPAAGGQTFSYDTLSVGGGVVGSRDDDDDQRHDEGADAGPKRFYTPVVLRIAEEHGIDLRSVQGSGAHGRVTRKDVERAVADSQSGGTAAPPRPATAEPYSRARADAPAAAPPGHAPAAAPPGYAPAAAPPGYAPAAGPPSDAPAAGPPGYAPAAGAFSDAPAPAAGPPGYAAAAGAPSDAAVLLPARPADASAPVAAPPAGRTPTPAPTAGTGDEDRPLTPMRRAIAEHMLRARAEIPDAWSLVEIDVTHLVRFRALQQAEWQAREGYELTYLPFFIKAVVAGLRAVPELNATWAGDHITLHRRYDLGIAVSLEHGLVVPVLRGADQLSVAGIARALRSIVLKARGGKLGLEDLQGATFTVNNPGSLGSIVSQPIVPVGQAGIVTMEAIVKRPVVMAEDAIAVRSMMNACLSFDHRVLDGGGALAFLREIKRQIETVEYPVY